MGIEDMKPAMDADSEEREAWGGFAGFKKTSGGEKVRTADRPGLSSGFWVRGGFGRD